MQIELPFTSGTPKADVEASFPFKDVLMARMLVRQYIALGLRKPPSDLLLLDEAGWDKWLSEEAIIYLKEQKAKQQIPVAVIR